MRVCALPNLWIYGLWKVYGWIYGLQNLVVCDILQHCWYVNYLSSVDMHFYARAGIVWSNGVQLGKFGYLSGQYTCLSYAIHCDVFMLLVFMSALFAYKVLFRLLHISVPGAFIQQLELIVRPFWVHSRSNLSIYNKIKYHFLTAG